MGGGREVLPNNIVLDVIGSAAVAGQPLETDWEFGRLRGDIMRRVRRRAFDDQVRGGHQRGHFVGHVALVVAEVAALQLGQRQIAAVGFGAFAWQRPAVHLHVP